MTDPSPNPYASPEAAPADVERRRPVGSVILAILCLAFGVPLGGGWIIRFFGLLPMAPSSQSHTEIAAYVHLGMLAMMAIVAAVGLLSGRRWGWWLAIAFCCQGFASFVLISILLHGTSQLLLLRTYAKAAAFLLGWLYLNRRPIVRYFGCEKTHWWLVQFGLLAFSAAVAFTLTAD